MDERMIFDDEGNPIFVVEGETPSAAAVAPAAISDELKSHSPPLSFDDIPEIEDKELEEQELDDIETATNKLESIFIDEPRGKKPDVRKLCKDLNRASKKLREAIRAFEEADEDYLDAAITLEANKNLLFSLAQEKKPKEGGIYDRRRDVFVDGQMEGIEVSFVDVRKFIDRTIDRRITDMHKLFGTTRF
jgi:hypothetical protein